MFVNEDLAEDRVHAFSGVRHGAFQVHFRGGSFLAAAVQRFHPLHGVVDRLVDIHAALHGFATARHDGLGTQRAQRFQRGWPLLELGITGVDAGVVLDQVAREQHFFFRYPGDGVAAGMARAGMPDLHPHAAEVDHQLAGHLAPDRVAAGDHHGRPGQAGHAFGVAEQARETLHLALHVFGAAFDDQFISPLAGDDFGRAFGDVGAGAQHAHRVVMREQHVLDRLVADLADARDQVLRHRRRGGCVADHDELVADDHAGIRVTLGGVSPAMRAELLERDFFVGEVGLRGKSFGHGVSVGGRRKRQLA